MSVTKNLDLATQFVAVSPTGIPALSAAVEKARRAVESGDRIQLVDASIFAEHVGACLGILGSMIAIAANTYQLQTLPHDTILGKALDSTSRSNLIRLVTASLQPERRGLRALTGLFSGPLPLPLVSSIEELSNEIIDGVTIGVVLTLD